MKMSQKFLISSALIACSTSNVFAESEVTANLEGYFEFQARYLGQKGLDKKNNQNHKLTANNDKFGLGSQSAVKLNIANERDDLKYGAQVVLKPTAKSSSSPAFNGSHLFLESNRIGRFEFGSQFGAGTNMRIDGYEVYHGSVDWVDCAKLDPHNRLTSGFMPTPDFILDDVLISKGGKEAARTISYYTPELHGLQAGVSWIPDTANGGDEGLSENAAHVRSNGLKGLGAGRSIDVKNSISYGISYKKHIHDGLDFQTSFTGEYASKLPGNKGIVDPEEKLAKLNTYNLGAKVTYGNFSVAGAYGTLNKSFTAKKFDGDSRDTKYYSIGGAYNKGPVGASVVYFKSKRMKNDMDTISVSSDYKLAPGFAPYAEVSFFKGKGRYYDEDQQIKKDKISGKVFIIGAKLKF